jgi:flagellar basal-body rod protein FlgB
MLQVTKSYELMKEALDYRSIRQDMIASNIANADTPFYRPKDIRFEEMLKHKENEIYNKKDNKLQLAKTDSKHLDSYNSVELNQAVLYFRDGHNARNDGNSVDLDVETSEMAKNSIMYNALVSGLNKHKKIFTSVLDYSAKLS